MDVMQQIRERFCNDRFAALTGVEILEAEEGRSLCRLVLRPDHMNSNDTPMGGAIFTLADLAFAVAANAGHVHTTVSQHLSITFLAPARGGVLLAEATKIKEGRRTCLYQVSVTDDVGTQVAFATGNGFSID